MAKIAVIEEPKKMPVYQVETDPTIPEKVELDITGRTALYIKGDFFEGPSKDTIMLSIEGSLSGSPRSQYGTGCFCIPHISIQHLTYQSGFRGGHANTYYVPTHDNKHELEYKMHRKRDRICGGMFKFESVIFKLFQKL